MGATAGLSRAAGGRCRFRTVLRREAINDMTHFASANYAATVLWSVLACLLPLLVANLAGPETAAYFYVAAAAGGLVAMIPGGVSSSLFAHGSHDEGQLVRYTLESGRIILLRPRDPGAVCRPAPPVCADERAPRETMSRT